MQPAVTLLEQLPQQRTQVMVVQAVKPLRLLLQQQVLEPLVAVEVVPLRPRLPVTLGQVAVVTTVVPAVVAVVVVLLQLVRCALVAPVAPPVH